MTMQRILWNGRQMMILLQATTTRRYPPTCLPFATLASSTFNATAATTTTLQLGQQLLSYPSLQAAYKDRNIPSPHMTMTTNQALLKDVYNVMRYCLVHGTIGNDKLSLEFGHLLHTLVLPHTKRTIPNKLLQPVLDMGVVTLRLYQKEAKRLSFEELSTATELFRKMQSIQVYFDTTQDTSGNSSNSSTNTSRNIRQDTEGYQNMMRLALSQLLGAYSEWSSSRWRSLEEQKGILQDAEHLLLRIGQSSSTQSTPEQLLANVTPDATSFLKLMAAWAEVDRNRAKEIYALIMDLCHEHVLVETPAIIETYLSSTIHGAQHLDEAMTMVEQMAANYIAEPQKHPKPREATLSKLCGVLHYDPLTLIAHVERVHAVAASLNIPINHLLVNAVITAYAKATTLLTSVEQQMDLCGAMMEYLDAARESISWSEDQLPITYGVAIRAWAECNTPMASQQVRLLWDNAIAEEVPLDILTHNHVMRAQMHNPPNQAKQVFDHIQTHSMPNLRTWKYLFMAYEHGTKTIHDAEVAEAFLDQMMTLRKNQRPNRYIFNSVIAAWSNLQTIQGVERADAVLGRLCTEYEKQLQVLKNDPYRANVQAHPLDESFRLVVRGYTIHGNSLHLDRVTELMRHMLLLERARMEAPSNMKRYMSSVKPDGALLERVRGMYIKYYKGNEDIEGLMQSLKSTVVQKEGFQSILNSKSHNKVKEIINMMDSKLAQLPLAAKEDQLALYNVALHFIAEAAEGSRSTNAAESVLVKMERTDLIPDRMSYSNVMKAWTKIGTFPAIAQAEEHLMTFLDLNLEAANFEGVDRMHPSRRLNANCFNIVMNAYSKLNTSDGDDRVRQLYALMISASQTLPFLAPDMNSLRTFFESSPADVADTLLHDLVVQAESSEIKVPIVLFASALNKWANSGRNDAGERAEKVLRLQEKYSQNDRNAALSTISYNVVMKAISKSLPIQADLVDSLLEEMWIQQNVKVRPDQVTYNTAMSCYQRRGMPGDSEKCSNVLHRMIDRGSTPNILSICICMDAIRNSKQPDRVEQTLELLRLYQDKYNEEKTPSPKMFQLALKVMEEPGGCSSHLLRALEIFKEASEIGSLTPHIFASIINIFDAYAINREMRLSGICKLMNGCKKVGMVSPLNLDRFRQSVPLEMFRNVLELPLSSGVEDTSIESLPQKWRTPLNPDEQRLLFRQFSSESTKESDRLNDVAVTERLDRVCVNGIYVHVQQQASKEQLQLEILHDENEFSLALKNLVETEASSDTLLLQALTIFNDARTAGSLTPACVAPIFRIVALKEQHTMVRNLLQQCLGLGLLSDPLLDSLREIVPAEIFRDVLHVPRRVPLENVTLVDLPPEWQDGRGSVDQLDLSCMMLSSTTSDIEGQA